MSSSLFAMFEASPELIDLSLAVIRNLVGGEHCCAHVVLCVGTHN